MAADCDRFPSGVYFMTADSEVPVGIGRELGARAIVVQVVLLAVASTLR